MEKRRTVLDWAINEIELAMQENNADKESEILDNYVESCYKSALKAFKSLVEDEHSGMSIEITMSILNRLIEIKPLTPITEDDADWEKFMEEEDYISYQSMRMSSLFKYEYKNGKTKYIDVNRVSHYDVSNKDCLMSMGFIKEIIDEKYPITFPYSAERYIVETESFSTNADDESEAYDTMAIHSVKLPDGTIEPLGIYYHQKDEDSDLEEITKEMFEELKSKKRK